MRNKLYIFTPILISIAYIFYAAVSMVDSYESLGSSFSLSRLAELIVLCLGVNVILTDGKIYHTQLYRYWVFWLVWLAISFFYFRQGNSAFSIIVKVLFCPISFMAFYRCSYHLDEFPKSLLVTTIILFVVACFYHVRLTLSLNNVIMLAEGYVQSNYIYWPMCCMSFLFLIDKKKVQYPLIILLLICVAISQKRAPMFAVAISMLPFLLVETKNKRLRFIIVIIVAVIGLSFFFGNYIDRLFYRVSQIEEDEGSNRIPLWLDMIDKIGQFEPIDFLIGKGYGTVSQTGHSLAHNDFLQMVYEYGIVGAIFYIRFIILIIKRTVHLNRIKSKYFFGYFACTGIIIVMGLLSSMLVFDKFFAFLCAYMGFVEAQCFIPGKQLENHSYE